MAASGLAMVLAMACGDDATRPGDPPPEPADLVFRGGAVVTLENGVAEALAVRGRTIVAVGTSGEVAAFQDGDTRIVELEGRALLPGFVEGHAHTLRFPERRGRTLDDAVEAALRHGITSIAELAADGPYVDELLAAEAQGRLRLRVNLYPEYNAGFLDDSGETVLVEAWFPGNPPVTDPLRRLRIPGIKVFVDGAFGRSRGCLALTEPYPEEFRADPAFQARCRDPRGTLYLEPGELAAVVSEIQDAGFSVAMHAMGDRAVDAALDALAGARSASAPPERRHQIHHSSVLRPDQIARYRELGVLASVRGYFNTCAQEHYRYWYGPDRFEWAANRFALPGAGVRAFAEGDFGWTTAPDDRSSPRPLDPLLTLWGLVTHSQLDGQGGICRPEPWIARHEIGVERALRMLTVEAAYASGMEEHVGTLRPGKLADLVVLDRNPLTVEPDTLKELEVALTMVDGVVEYCSEECIAPGAGS